MNEFEKQIRIEAQIERKRMLDNKNLFKDMIYSGIYNDVVKDYILSFVDTALDKYKFGVSPLNMEEYIKVEDLRKILHG